MYDCTEARFLANVTQHEMAVLRDDGLYRHIRFKRPNSGVYYFDLITWPGFLCYCGDMGTYVFSRVADMFEFFRESWNTSKKRELCINPGYWAGKVKSNSHHGNGVECFSEERFKAALKSDFDIFFEGQDPGSDAGEEEMLEFEARKKELWTKVEDQILSVDSLEYEGISAAMEFDENGLQFIDFYEHNFIDYTFHFIWCCYALVWGITKYDEAKKATTI